MLNFKPPFEFQAAARLYLEKIVLLLLAALGVTQALAASVTLAWDPSPSGDVVAYRLYYGTAPGTYTHSLLVENSTTATVKDLTPGVRYYFAATSVSSTGLESPFSAEISFVPPEPPPTRTLVDLDLNPQNQPVVTITGVPGQSWRVQTSSNLVDWVDLGIVTNSLAGTTRFTDPAANLQPRRFYRLKAPEVIETAGSVQ